MRRAPRICGCGHTIAPNTACPCEVRRAAARKAAAEAKRPHARERGYGSKWQAARAEYLEANPTCRTAGCGKPATVVDHITPHRGDLALFWRRSNWQPLCAGCHGRKTARRDGGFGRAVKCD